MKYPRAGYGGNFYRWAFSRSRKPYYSWGNGSAMRVSPVGYAYSTLEEVLERAKKSSEITHNHPEGIKGAQATAVAIFMAREACGKDEIKKHIEETFDYDLSRSYKSIKATYSFKASCQETVPEAIIAFLESKDYEDAIRKAISLGGDSDTLACMSGGIAQAYYGTIADYIIKEVRQILDQDLLAIVDEFNNRYGL